MKPVAPISSAQGDAFVADEFSVPLLSLFATIVIGRMGEVEGLVMEVRVDGILLIERDAKRFFRRQRLEDVHVVGDDCLFPFV